jgi:uncharacterized protein
VIPRAKVTALDGMHADAVRLRVAAPPADGKANAAVLSYLAEVLGVRRQDLTLLRGAMGRDKAVEVAGLDVAEVLRRLASADPAAEEGVDQRPLVDQYLAGVAVLDQPARPGWA